MLVTDLVRLTDTHMVQVRKPGFSLTLRKNAPIA